MGDSFAGKLRLREGKATVWDHIAAWLLSQVVCPNLRTGLLALSYPVFHLRGLMGAVTLPSWWVGTSCLVTKFCPTLRNPMDCSLPGSSVPGTFPGKNARVSCQFLLQGIFLTQGSNLGLPHCRQTLYRLSHTLIQYTFILTWLYLQRPFFQMRSHSQVLGVRILIPHSKSMISQWREHARSSLLLTQK